MSQEEIQEPRVCPACEQALAAAEPKRFCPYCGRAYHAACWTAGGERCVVAECAAGRSSSPPETESPEPVLSPVEPPPEELPEPPELIPLEDRARYGVLGGLMRTWAGAAFAPSALFPKVRNSSALGPPILMAALCSLGMSLGGVWLGVISLAGAALPDAPMNPDDSRQAACAYFVLAVLAPFAFLGIFFVRALVLHGLLLALGGARGGWRMTLRGLGYAQAPAVFAAVPCCGLLIWPFWEMVVAIVGLADAHDTDTWRAALAVLIPSLGVLGILGLKVALGIAEGLKILQASGSLPGF